MSTFVVQGDSSAIAGRAALLSGHGRSLLTAADSLARLSTQGWSGRAADAFRERFDMEPGRWRDAGEAFVAAADGLVGYADVVRRAQSEAARCSAEFAGGELETGQARAEYDAQLAGQRRDQGVRPGAVLMPQLTLAPRFVDPGLVTRERALTRMASVRTDLAAASSRCAATIHLACERAPQSRSWLETGLAFVGGVLQGAGSAVAGIVTMPLTPIAQFSTLTDLATGRLTIGEVQAKELLVAEQVSGLWDAAREHPGDTAKELGKALLDWDTWTDDPAAAIGHLIPDAALAVLTAGAGTAATKGLTTAVKTRVSVGSIVDVGGDRYLRPSLLDTQALRTLVKRDGAGSVDSYVMAINPKFGAGGPWEMNCGACTRAFADTFQGVETRAAPGDLLGGESPDVMFQWSGMTPTTRAYDRLLHGTEDTFTLSSYDAVERAAADLPDGTVLAVGVDWVVPPGEDPAGHWFNAVVEHGRLRWVDSQKWEAGPWPPDSGAQIRGIDVIYREATTPTWKGLDLAP